VKLLQRKIQTKALKLPDYKLRVPETALLLVANRLKCAGMIEYDPGPDGRLDGCGFKAVYFLMFPDKFCQVA
jgi:hypothetical protein